MIVLRICALFALLYPVSMLASIATKGENEIVFAMIYPLGFLGLQIAAISTLVFAGKRKIKSLRAWPSRVNTIAAAICVVFPWVAEALDVPFKPLILIPVSALEIYVAVQLLIAPGSEQNDVTMAERMHPGHISAADVVDCRALGRRHEAEGTGRTS